MLGSPFCEEILLAVQPEPALAQLEAISSPVTACLGEEPDPYLATASFLVVVESN